MHLATALLLACACTVYAQLIPSILSAGVSRTRSWDSTTEEWPQSVSPPANNMVYSWPDGEEQPAPIYPSNAAVSPYDSTLTYLPKRPSNPSAPWDVQDDQDEFSVGADEAWTQEQQDDRISKYPSLPQGLSKAWLAPTYHQSLQDFEDTVSNITGHFTPEAYKGKDVHKFRYIVVVATVNALAHEVAAHGWPAYKYNYKTLVKKFMENAAIDPQSAAYQISCVLSSLSRSIVKIKNLINNPVIKFVCRVQPAACDTVVFTHIMISGDKELNTEASYLMSIGNAAQIFQKKYAGAFEAVSTTNVFSYLPRAQDALQELVFTDAHIFKTIPESLRSCILQPRRLVRYY